MVERLQKMISQAGLASRRHAEKLIINGRVAVNGRVVTKLGTKVDPQKDKVTVDGKLITGEKFVYILLYKPKGVVTTLNDPQKRKTVVDLIKDVPQRIYPVGRLDYNTEGLLLLTNDGELTNALIHPSKKISKVYRAVVDGYPTEEELDKIRVGMKLEDGMTAPAIVNIIGVDHENNNTTLEITIHEGKNRQIRRMCEKIGHPVKKLKRVKFAFLDLKGVKRGGYRFLTPDEIKELKSLSQL